jgi:hypothetical protein
MWPTGALEQGGKAEADDAKKVKVKKLKQAKIFI